MWFVKDKFANLSRPDVAFRPGGPHAPVMEIKGPVGQVSKFSVERFGPDQQLLPPPEKRSVMVKMKMSHFGSSLFSFPPFDQILSRKFKRIRLKRHVYRRGRSP